MIYRKIHKSVKKLKKIKKKKSIIYMVVIREIPHKIQMICIILLTTYNQR